MKILEEGDYVEDCRGKILKISTITIECSEFTEKLYDLSHTIFPSKIAIAIMNTYIYINNLFNREVVWDLNLILEDGSNCSARNCCSYVGKSKDNIEILVKAFKEGKMSLTLLVYLLKELKVKNPKDTALDTQLSIYGPLEEKWKECVLLIEEGKNSDQLEEELIAALGKNHVDIDELRTIKRWRDFKEKNKSKISKL